MKCSISTTSTDFCNGGAVKLNWTIRQLIFSFSTCFFPILAKKKAIAKTKLSIRVNKKIESLWNRNDFKFALRREKIVFFFISLSSDSFKAIIVEKLSTMWFIDILCVLQCMRSTCKETKCYIGARMYWKHIKQSANGGFSFYYVVKQEDFCQAIKRKSSSPPFYEERKLKSDEHFHRFS